MIELGLEARESPRRHVVAAPVGIRSLLDLVVEIDIRIAVAFLGERLVHPLIIRNPQQRTGSASGTPLHGSLTLSSIATAMPTACGRYNRAPLSSTLGALIMHPIRPAGALTVLVFCSIVALLGALSIGSVSIPLSSVIAAVFHNDRDSASMS